MISENLVCFTTTHWQDWFLFHSTRDFHGRIRSAICSTALIVDILTFCNKLAFCIQYFFLLFYFSLLFWAGYCVYSNSQRKEESDNINKYCWDLINFRGSESWFWDKWERWISLLIISSVIILSSRVLSMWLIVDSQNNGSTTRYNTPPFLVFNFFKKIFSLSFLS